MSKQKMLAAQELIDEKRYDEARAVLRTMNNPEARKMLTEIDATNPEISAGKLATQKTALMLLALFCFGAAAYVAFLLLKDYGTPVGAITAQILAPFYILFILVLGGLGVFSLRQANNEKVLRRRPTGKDKGKFRAAAVVIFVVGIFSLVFGISRQPVNMSNLFFGFVQIIISLSFWWRSNRLT